MKTKPKSKIPKKPSALIRLALSDLAKVERDKRYVVDMGRWHEMLDGRCHVCLAGSVIAKSQHFPVGEDRLARKPIPKWAEALNAFREGYIFAGLEELFGEERAWSLSDKYPELTAFPGMHSYRRSPKEFKNDMRKMADMLEKRGL